MGYFSKKKYKKDIVTRETFVKWKEKNPQYKDVDFPKFKKLFNTLKVELINVIMNSSKGVRIKHIGIFVIKILDIDFNCSQDFLRAKCDYGDKYKKDQPFVSFNNPKKIKVSWKKDRYCNAILTTLGSTPSNLIKDEVKFINNKTNKYAKSNITISSKCKEEKEKSLFELIDND
jgi:hypothetical protein